MKRSANPLLSSPVEASGAHDRQVLLEQEDLTDASRRTYLSDLRHFIAWYEAKDVKSTDETASSQTEFDPQAITTPALTRSRTDLQKDLCQKPNSVNRAIISLKRSWSWARHMQRLSSDPSVPVNLVGEEEHAPRHLEDEEEHALGVAVTHDGTLRDRVLLVLLLQTGLRAREMCQLRRGQVKLGKQSGTLEVEGLRNTDRDVPLHATARKILEEVSANAASRGRVVVSFSQESSSLVRTSSGQYRQKGCR